MREDLRASLLFHMHGAEDLQLRSQFGVQMWSGSRKMAGLGKK